MIKTRYSEMRINIKADKNSVDYLTENMKISLPSKRALQASDLRIVEVADKGLKESGG
ncbi:MAG: hypothetical protein WC974_09370 [Thermoplasmata archaeon]